MVTNFKKETELFYPFSISVEVLEVIGLMTL